MKNTYSYVDPSILGGVLSSSSPNVHHTNHQLLLVHITLHKPIEDASFTSQHKPTPSLAQLAQAQETGSSKGLTILAQ